MLYHTLLPVPLCLNNVSDEELHLEGWQTAPTVPLEARIDPQLPSGPAVYSLEELENGRVLYVGETMNLKRRIERQFGRDQLSMLYDTVPARASIRYLAMEIELKENQWRRTRILQRFPTEWNI